MSDTQTPSSRWPFRNMAIMILAGLLVLAGSTGLWRWWRVEETPPRPRIEDVFRRPEPVSTGYVGSERCTICHAEIAADYTSHSMSQSLFPVAEAPTPEDYSANTLFEPLPGLQYLVERREDGSVWHHERMVDLSGEVIYDQAVPVSHVVGSGSRGCSYLIDFDGKFYQSPVSWYSGSGIWDLSPGYEPERHLRFERRISDGCLSCHASLANPNPDIRNAFQPEAFAECTIGCERCHGPGREHVILHESGGSGRDTIVNPAHLDPVRRDAVCFQCHLQGQLRVTRYGREEFDFRPGMYMSDVWTVFLKSRKIEEGETPIVSQMEQMHLSACYQGSNGQLGCISCHDPHRSPSPRERISFYREKCQACHDSQGTSVCSEPLDRRRQRSPEDSCIVCHMPALSASDVPHTAITNHQVPRFPDAQGEIDPARLTARSDRIDPRDEKYGRLWFEEGTQIPEHEFHRAWVIFLSDLADNGNLAEPARRALDHFRNLAIPAEDDLVLYESLGKSSEVLGDLQQAERWWEQALAIDPRDETVLELMALLYHSRSQLPEAAGYYERLVEVNPHMATYFGRQAHVLGQLGRWDEGIAAANRALELNPSLIQAHGWLAEVYELRGELELAREHRAIVERMREVQRRWVSRPAAE